MTETLHKIRVSLYNNLLTDDPDDYSAKVITEKTLDISDVCESSVSRGGADSTAQTMEHNVRFFFEEMAYLLRDGFVINTGYFIASGHLNGVFNSPDEPYTPGKHTFSFQFIQGEIMRDKTGSITIVVTGMVDQALP